MLTQDEREALAPIVERVAKINAQIQELKWTQKEVIDSAWEKAGCRPSVVKQLAKEAAFDDVKKEKLKQHEERLHECRTALGMLLDTPLGAAATASEENQPDADEPQGHVTDPKYKARREKKSRKRPELVAVN